MTFQIEVKWNVAAFGPIFRQGVNELAKQIRNQSRADVKAGIRGRFSRGVIVKTERLQSRDGYVIREFLKPAFAKVWEYGGVSVGKPLMWVPVFPNKLKLRRYGGRLVRRGRALISQGSGVKVRGLHGTGSRQAIVMYAGVSSVSHRRRFHLRDIALRETNKLVNYLGTFKTR
jgi:hypothetical protein